MSIIGGANSWNTAVTGVFSELYLPVVNDFHPKMVMRAHDLAFALITLSALANIPDIMRFRLSRAGVIFCSRPLLRINDD